MTAEEHFFEDYQPWRTWYESEQGAFALDCTLHLTERMLSHWPRRRHTVLHIHFEHWKTIELLWGSGFDVCVISPSEAFSQSVPQHVRHMLSGTLARPAALDHLPFENDSFDYVIMHLQPATRLYPPLHAMFAEMLRIATKGVLLQGWNPCSFLGIQHTWHKKNMPPFLQAGPWFTWRDICHTLRAEARIVYDMQGHIRTKSTLIGPLGTWKPAKKSISFSPIRNINAAILPGAIGGCMQVRFTFTEGIPLTGTALRVKVLQDMTPAMEGAKRSNTLKKF